MRGKNKKNEKVNKVEKAVKKVTDPIAVSYTHLDVYKRQDKTIAPVPIFLSIDKFSKLPNKKSSYVFIKNRFSFIEKPPL